MEKTDWASLGFGYHKTDYNVRCYYRNGKWGELEVTQDETITLHMGATCLHYGQEAFEGQKAFRGKDGKIRIFRIHDNAKRMIRSAEGVVMQPVPEELFVEACLKAVKLNERFVPPYESGASLYIRPLLIGLGEQVGVKPAPEYLFVVFVTPVGPYFKGGAKPLTLCVSDFDRAAPNGTGHVKAGLNYAMSLHASVTAHAAGYDENVFLDPGTRTYIEETGGANFLFVTKDGEVVTPKSDSILPSITRRSLVYVAEHYLGLKVTQRPVKLSELDEFAECGLCGTAAVISPVGRIVDHGREICFPSGMDAMGPVTKKLYDTLTGIQMGTIEAPEGWIRKIV